MKRFGTLLYTGISVMLYSTLALAESEEPEKPAFEGIKYDRQFNDDLTDEYVWSKNKWVHDKQGPEGSTRHVRHIDGDFFDEFIVHRWTSEWLAGDTTWVIGIGKPVPWNQDYMYSLSARTVHILNDRYY